ncbi:MAG: class II glutamine amidotransferase [Thermoprotei archaeon]
MCRLLAFNVESFDFKFVDALRRAAKDDPFFSLGTHDDGWGASVYYFSKGQWRLIAYKTKVPIFEDETLDNLFSLIEGKRAAGVVHARKGRRFLYALPNNHPYHARARNYDLHFVHNGSIGRKAFQTPDYPATDSFLYFAEIVREVERGQTPYEAYKSVTEALKPYASSLNSALLAYDEVQGPSLYFVSYHNKARAKEVEEYYRVYYYNGYVFSSTVKHYLGLGNPVEEGQVLELTCCPQV